MKLFIAFAVVIVATMAAPLDESKNVVVLKYENDNIGIDSYKFAYEQSDGSKHQEEAELKNVGSENEGISVRGSFSFVAPDGQTYTVNYVADENGFQPEGAHLPNSAAP